MARPKGPITIKQFIQTKEYNVYRNFRNEKMYSLNDLLKWADEWEEERQKEINKQLEKED